MRKVKKSLAILLAAMLAAGALASCGNDSGDDTSGGTGGGGDSEKVSLSFWKSPHSDMEADYWADIIEQFNEEYPNVSVEFLSVAWDSVVEKETAAFASGDAPDITFQTEQMPLYAKNGYLLSLNDYMSDEKKAAYPQSSLDYCSYDGNIVGVPFVALNSVMFYNVDLFEDAGITEVPTNWDEFLAAAQATTKDTDGDGTTDQWGVVYFPRDDYWQPLTFAIQAGADQWNANRTNVGFNNEAGIEGLTFFSDLYNEYGVALPLDVFSSQDEGEAYFYNGQVAMFPQQCNYANTIRSNAPDLNLGVFLLPAGPAEDAAHSEWNFTNIGMLSLTASSPNPDAAYDFIEFVTRPEIESQYLSAVGFFSPQLSTNETMYTDDEILQVCAEGITADMYLSPVSDYTNGMYQGMKTLWETLALGASTPEDAVQTLDDTLYAMSGEHGE